MSIWVRITDFVTETAGSAFSGLVEQVRTLLSGDPETRARVTFSIAMIALSAKMAKADGVVTDEEVRAFLDIFEIPDGEMERVSSLYNLAKQDTAGFETYAAQLAGLCPGQQGGCSLLHDILDGLFHIAKADGVIHEREMAFLARIAEIFDLTPQSFDAVVARHVDQGEHDPWRVLGIERDTDLASARKRYLQLVRENHPDALAARGVPPEFMRMAHERIAAINAAWDVVERNWTT